MSAGTPQRPATGSRASWVRDAELVLYPDLLRAPVSYVAGLASIGIGVVTAVFSVASQRPLALLWPVFGAVLLWLGRHSAWMVLTRKSVVDRTHRGAPVRIDAGDVAGVSWSRRRITLLGADGRAVLLSRGWTRQQAEELARVGGWSLKEPRGSG